MLKKNLDKVLNDNVMTTIIRNIHNFIPNTNMGDPPTSAVPTGKPKEKMTKQGKSLNFAPINKDGEIPPFVNGELPVVRVPFRNKKDNSVLGYGLVNKKTNQITTEDGQDIMDYAVYSEGELQPTFKAEQEWLNYVGSQGNQIAKISLDPKELSFKLKTAYPKKSAKEISKLTEEILSLRDANSDLVQTKLMELGVPSTWYGYFSNQEAGTVKQRAFFDLPTDLHINLHERSHTEDYLNKRELFDYNATQLTSKLSGNSLRTAADFWGDNRIEQGVEEVLARLRPIQWKLKAQNLEPTKENVLNVINQLDKGQRDDNLLLLNAIENSDEMNPFDTERLIPNNLNKTLELMKVISQNKKSTKQSNFS